MRKYKKNVSKAEIQKTLGSQPKSHIIGKMNQGRYQRHPIKLMDIQSRPNSTFRMKWQSQEKPSARKSSKVKYLPRNEESLHPVEKVSRPQNRNQQKKEPKKK